MARLLFCRHRDCGRSIQSEAGYMPTLCPKCERVARWTTTPPMEQDEPPPLDWLPIDRVILICLGIAAE